MICEFVFFRQIQIEIALSKPTSERRNSLTIRTYCSCSVTLSPSSSHRIHGSVKLLYSEIRGGWEKWNNIFSIGIFLIHVNVIFDSKKVVSITSFYSFAFTFLNCSGLKVSWLWEPSCMFYSPSQSLFLHPKYNSLLKLNKQGNMNSQLWKAGEGTLHCLKYLISWVSSLK